MTDDFEHPKLALAAAMIDMVRRSPPAGAPVVPGSTPVVSFGDVTAAVTATLGINPSSAEFYDRGVLLRGAQRRLATLESLGAKHLDQLTEKQAMTVVGDCATYFSRRPYRRWFDPLDYVLRVGTNTSYYDGSACHLDLVQWATDPVWGKIGNSAVRRSLIDDGLADLAHQLDWTNLRLVLLNGRQVIEQISRLGLTKLHRAEQIPFGSGLCQLYVGQRKDATWLGWSTNLQSSYGVSNEFKKALGHRIAEVL